MNIPLPTRKVDDLRASSRVDVGVGVGNGAGGVIAGGEVAPHFICDPAQTVLRP